VAQHARCPFPTPRTPLSRSCARARMYALCARVCPSHGGALSQFLLERKVDILEYSDPHFLMVKEEASDFTKGMETILGRREIKREKFYEIEGHHRQMLKELFMEMDDDGSCMLEQDEVALLVARLGQRLSPAELKLAMAAMDGDGSGYSCLPRPACLVHHHLANAG
jgi:hypothetical protein